MAKAIVKRSVSTVAKRVNNPLANIPQVGALLPKANYRQLLEVVTKGIEIIANNNLTKEQEKAVTNRVLDVYKNSEFKELLDQLPR